MVANFQEFLEFGMEQRFTHQVEGHHFGQWGDLRNDCLKRIQIHEFLRTDDLRAKAALEIADIAYLDVDLVKTLFGRNHELILAQN